VEVAADGQPHFTIHESVAWDRLVCDAPSLALAARADAVCFGSLAQRTPANRAAIQQLVAATPKTALRVFDINLRQQYYTRKVIVNSLILANALKINDTELPEVARLLKLTGDTREQMAHLARHFELRVVALTRGAHGSLLYADGQWVEHPGLPVKIADSVGAGDAFTAAMVMGLLRRLPLAEIAERANRVAAFVCTQVGATPRLPAEFTAV
jgi:fructokinase